MPATKLHEIHIDHRFPMPTGQWREELLGRPLTAIERAADDEEDRVIARNKASHALWLAQMSDKEKRRWGIAL